MTTIEEKVALRAQAKLAAEPVDAPEEDIGEIEIAEYIVFLLALDTYLRYLHENNGQIDELARKGVALLRGADRLHEESIKSFVGGHLPSESHKRMLLKAFRFLPNPDGIARRALQIRTLLSRGGAATSRAIFKSNKALLEVRAAIAAATIDNADTALDKFAVIPLKNSRLRVWIDKAAELAGSGEVQNAVTAGAAQGSDATTDLLVARVQASGNDPGSEATAVATAKQDVLFEKVQRESTEVAKKVLEVTGKEDLPPTKSEVIGIATAAVAAAQSDPTKLQNIPPSFMTGNLPLDPEQMDAALTDGKVLVAAGAGAGKSSTLVCRIAYLLEEKGVQPSRIFACSFNRKAADELQAKIAKKSGETAMKRMSVDTMHSLFKRFITGDANAGIPAMGSAEQQALFQPARNISDPPPGQKSKEGPRPINMTNTIRGVWSDCGKEGLVKKYGFPDKWVDTVPKAKKMNLYLNKWRGNDITLEQAKASVTSKVEAQAYIWYETYMGLKGDIPGWRPPCSNTTSADKWMDKFRPGKERLGDMDDMIKVFRDILRDNPAARKRVQGMYDHLLVDECQDLNVQQHQIFDMMSEHVTDGSDGKSLWMVGDDKQAIYQFRGARPDLFTSLNGKEGWKTKMIKTNYRCEPEIVEAANKLVSHNGDQIPMEARANPTKPKGQANIDVSVPGDNAAGAIDTISSIQRDLASNPKAEAADYAVLARTNAELNDYETACIIAEIPYARAGGGSFLDSPESKPVLGIMDLASGADYEKMQKSLGWALTKPDRGLFMGPDQVETIVKEVIEDIARAEGMNTKDVNPFQMLTKRSYARDLAEGLKGPFKNKLMSTGEWLWKKAVDELADALLEMGTQVGKIRKQMQDNPKQPVEDLLKSILDDVKASTGYLNRKTGEDTRKTSTLREQITSDLSLYGDDDDDEEEEEKVEQPIIDENGMRKEERPSNPAAGLGAVQFLYMLATPNESDHNTGNDPSVAEGFKKKLDRYMKTAATVKVDLRQWALDQRKLPPEKREKRPRCMILSTIHKVKGAEWENCTVVMPEGIFPPKRKADPDAPPPDPKEVQAKMEAERNLAYVALTRAKRNLRVVCPKAPSQFVFEAGLSPGENVIKPGVPKPEEGGEIKTASLTGSTYEGGEIQVFDQTPPEEFDWSVN